MYPALPCVTNTQLLLPQFLGKHWLFLGDCIEVSEQKQVITCIPVCAASLLLSQEHWDSSWLLVPSFRSCELCFQSSQPVKKYNVAVVSKLRWDSFHIANTLTAITYTSLHSNKAFMAFSRASKQAMIFTTEQSQSSTFIRMACQLLLMSSSTGVSSQKGGTVEILVCLGSIFESCMQASLDNIAPVSCRHRTLSRWILLLLFSVWVFGGFLMGFFLWILIFLSCLKSNNIYRLIKCLDSGLANKRRRPWRYQGRDSHSLKES